MAPRRLRVRTLRGRVITYGTLGRIGRNFSGVDRLRGVMGPSSRVARRFVLQSGILLNKLSGECSDSRQVRVLVRTVRVAVPGFQLDRVRSCLCALSRVGLIGRVKGTCSLTNSGRGTTSVFCQLLRCVEHRLRRVIASGEVLPLILCGFTESLSLLRECRRDTEITEGKGRTYVGCKRCRMLRSYLRVRTRYSFFLNGGRRDTRQCHRTFCVYGIVECRSSLRVVHGRTRGCLSVVFWVLNGVIL